MQALTSLFLLFNALNFVHAATVPHDVDIAPRHVAPLDESAIVPRTSLPPPDVAIEPADWNINDPAPAGGLTLSFSTSASIAIRSAFDAGNCQNQTYNFEPCLAEVSSNITPLPTLNRRFVGATIYALFLMLIMFGLWTASTSSSAGSGPITVNITPDELRTAGLASVPVFNQVDMTCINGKGESYTSFHFVNIPAPPDGKYFCYQQPNCQSIEFNSFNVGIEVFNTNNCDPFGNANWAYPNSTQPHCATVESQTVSTLGTNSFYFIPLC